MIGHIQMLHNCGAGWCCCAGPVWSGLSNAVLVVCGRSTSRVHTEQCVLRFRLILLYSFFDVTFLSTNILTSMFGRASEELRHQHWLEKNAGDSRMFTSDEQQIKKTNINIAFPILLLQCLNCEIYGFCSLVTSSCFFSVFFPLQRLLNPHGGLKDTYN